MPKTKRILISLGTAIALGGIYLCFFGVQTISAIVVRYGSREIPGVSRVPAPLPDSTVSSIPHKRISDSGYEFELPWDDVDQDKAYGAIHLVIFHSKNVLWFSTFPRKSLINCIMENQHLDAQKFQQLYGENAFASDYNFHRALLEATPSEITPFISRNQAIRLQSLVAIKALSMPIAGSGLFAVETADAKGFQFEDPQAHPRKITDDLYSDAGGVELIFFQKTDGTAPTLSQAEINRVIQSIHKVPTPPASDQN
jgi:hypothetical protein